MKQTMTYRTQTYNICIDIQAIRNSILFIQCNYMMTFGILVICMLHYK